MITPVLLCGGSGTRLWPLSRKSYPKQFLPLLGKESLFQTTLQRLRGANFSEPIILTGADMRFIVAEQMLDIGCLNSTVLVEPEGRNTAPAVLAAALHLEAIDPDDVMIIAPSDHQISDVAVFQKVVAQAEGIARSGKIVTLGILPDRPETGYGWLELSEVGERGPQPLCGFVEKPTEALAKSMLHGGRYLWNAGIFICSVRVLLEAYRKHAPEMIPPIQAAVRNADYSPEFHFLDATSWDKVEAISLDSAIMEKAENLTVIPFNGGWSDLGEWESVWRETEEGQNGVSMFGATHAIDCQDSLLRSETDQLEVIGLGLENMVVVATSDAVLVADRSRVQEVRKAVEYLKAKGAHQAQRAAYDHRPWGGFETLEQGTRFQVKRIVVNPGASLSLQSHMHRSEHWIVVSGTAKVTIDDDVRLLSENQSVYIPLGAVHRMENPGKVPMVLIEVQTGSYLGEDDIIRYDDIYARGQGAKG